MDLICAKSYGWMHWYKYFCSGLCWPDATYTVNIPTCGVICFPLCKLFWHLYNSEKKNRGWLCWPWMSVFMWAHPLAPKTWPHYSSAFTISSNKLLIWWRASHQQLVEVGGSSWRIWGELGWKISPGLVGPEWPNWDLLHAAVNKPGVKLNGSDLVWLGCVSMQHSSCTT